MARRHSRQNALMMDDVKIGLASSCSFELELAHPTRIATQGRPCLWMREAYIQIPNRTENVHLNIHIERNLYTSAGALPSPT